MMGRHPCHDCGKATYGESASCPKCGYGEYDGNCLCASCFDTEVNCDVCGLDGCDHCTEKCGWCDRKVCETCNNKLVQKKLECGHFGCEIKEDEDEEDEKAAANSENSYKIKKKEEEKRAIQTDRAAVEQWLRAGSGSVQSKSLRQALEAWLSSISESTKKQRVQ